MSRTRTAPAPRLHREKWSPNRACSRCGENDGPDQMVYSTHTERWYCGDPDRCAARLAAVAELVTACDAGAAIPLELEQRLEELYPDPGPHPSDPEYADVDETGQLSLGVLGEQRTLDGLAPAAHPTQPREELAR